MVNQANGPPTSRQDRMTQMPPRRVLLINPNTTQSMTDTMVAQLTARAPAGTQIRAVTAGFGHPVIATRVAYAVAARAVLDAYAGFHEPHDAVILGCFGDPGLEALREVATVPVIALADASFHAARALGRPFAVLTAGPAWKPMLEERLALHPARDLCLEVHALAGTGLDFADHSAAAIGVLNTAAHQLAAAGAGAIILGGAALAGLASRLTAPVRFVDCIDAALTQAMEASAPPSRTLR